MFKLNYAMACQTMQIFCDIYYQNSLSRTKHVIIVALNSVMDYNTILYTDIQCSNWCHVSLLGGDLSMIATAMMSNKGSGE